MGILRFLLALSVVAKHFGAIFTTEFVGGKIAVQSFFIISGFYMSLILNEKYIEKNNSYKLFITNRFLRLYPVYWVVAVAILLTYIAIVVVLKRPSETLELYAYMEHYPFPFVFLIITNTIIFFQELVMFLGLNPENGHLIFTGGFLHPYPPLYKFLIIPPSWTLSLELMFYLIAPFVLRKGMKTIIGIITLSFLLRLFIFYYLGFKNDPWTYRFFPTELMFFLLGNLSYQLYTRLETWHVNKYINIGILIFMVAFTIFFLRLPTWQFSFPFSVNEMIYFLFIVLSIPFLFNYFKKNRFDREIGELSYPLYISHMFVCMICFGLHLTFMEQSYIIALLSIGFAYVLNRVVADPIEKYRQLRLKTRRITTN